MFKRGLFKSAKTIIIAAFVILITGTVIETENHSLSKGMVKDASSVISSIITPVTAYAAQHQNFYDSTGYYIQLDNDTWHCYNSSGYIDYDYDGIVENEYGWWKITNGEVDFSYNGLTLNQYGWWKITGGTVDFGYNGLAENEYGWWKITGGTVDFGYDGLAENEYGWWKITDGTVDFTYNGMAQNQYGWWKITGGAVDFSFNGIASNKYGYWVIANGGVDFSYNGDYPYGTYTYKVTNGYAASEHVHTWNPVYGYRNVDEYGEIPVYAQVKRMNGYPFEILWCDELGISRSANQLYLDWHVGENQMMIDIWTAKYMNGELTMDEVLALANDPSNFPYPETYNYTDPRANRTAPEQIGTRWGVVGTKIEQYVDHYECIYYGCPVDGIICDGYLTVEQFDELYKN